MTGRKVFLWKCRVEPYGCIHIEAADVKEASLNALSVVRSFYTATEEFEVVSVEREFQRLRPGVWG